MKEIIKTIKKHEFFKWYANLPLAKRDIPISFKDFGFTTMNDIYFFLKKNDSIEAEEKVLKEISSFLKYYN